MAKQEIQISSVKLINGGLKGLTVKYLEINDVQSNLYKSEVTKNIKRPIVGTDLLLKFDEFAKYITEICSVEEGKVTATGITAAHNKFLLSGTIEVLEGAKKSAINTPNITEEDGYEKWTSVQENVDELFEMVLSYMEEEAFTASNEQMILQFNKGKEGFDAEAVKNMTQEEQVIEATKLLEKIGCVVINPHEEDMPGGIEISAEDFKDISAGDEKQELFNEDLTEKTQDIIDGIDEKEFLEKVKEVIVETFDTPTVDFDKVLAETELKKQKAAEHLAKLKQSQAKVEKVIDEDDDFVMPLRKVM